MKHTQPSDIIKKYTDIAQKAFRGALDSAGGDFDSVCSFHALISDHPAYYVEIGTRETSSSNPAKLARVKDDATNEVVAIYSLRQLYADIG